MSAIHPRPRSCCCCAPMYASFLSCLILCLCNQLLGLHLPTCVDVYLGIMWRASCIRKQRAGDKGQVPGFTTMGSDILPKRAAGSSVGSYIHSIGSQAGVEHFCYRTDRGAVAVQTEERDCCRSASRQREQHSNAYIHQSCPAARALRRSVVTVSLIVWIKLLPPVGLLACVGLSTSSNLRHGPFCLAGALRLLHIACLLDSCRLH